MEEIIRFIIKEVGWELIWKPIAHFVLSGGVGLLVYWLTWTTLSRSSSGDTQTYKLLKGESGIHHYSFLLALLFAAWVHIVEDYILDLF